MFANYSFLISLFAAAANTRERLLCLIGRGDPGGLEERLGRRIPLRMSPGRGIVINAASVGEVAEAESLIRALHEEVPEIEIVVTTGNKDGRARAQLIGDRTGAIVHASLLPWDRKRAFLRWLRRLNPTAVVTLESEIWPNLFLSCRHLNIPLFIVNGRIYQKDLWRYRLAPRFFRRVLSCVTWIGAQSETEQMRFCRIGAEASLTDVVGILKMTPAPVIQAGQDDRLEHLRTLDGPVITAGSTHHPEEALIVDSFLHLRHHYADLKLILAPRNVRRSGLLATECRKRNLRTASWSNREEVLKPWDALVIDEFGWLPSLYPLSAVAVIGGTFCEHGGHNLAEAAVHGCSVVTGPSVWNFQEMADEFLKAGGIVTTGTGQLTETLSSLLADKPRRRRLAAISQSVIERHSGCASRYATAILSRLPGREPLEPARSRGAISSAENGIRPSPTPPLSQSPSKQPDSR